MTLALWSKEHQLPNSVKKCSSIVIGSAHSYSWQYSIDNHMLEPAGEVKDLGIFIDSSLKFNSHIDSIVAKAHLRASLIHKCFVSKHRALLTRAFKGKANS